MAVDRTRSTSGPSREKNDLIVHDYFALVHGNYNADGDGEMHYEHDMDLAATWKQLATEYAECTE